MQVPHAVLAGATNLLEEFFSISIQITKFSFAGGGCINHGGRLTTSKGNFFIKWNDVKKYPGMFKAEAAGLKLLAGPEAIRIPRVLGTDERETYQFIILEFIEDRGRSHEHWNLLGTQLALLHKNSNDHYGLDHNNYMGSLSQINTTNNSWVDFFIERRLQVQLKLGIDRHVIPTATIKKFEALYKELPSILTTERPTLVHGDLWSGNLITDEIGNPCLIDPAVYYGHREVDLAMTQLFGGFSTEFYSAYQDVFPCESGWQQRLDIYNLYPLLVHVNLFGQSYLHQVDSILNSTV